jgi:DNA-dependent protein kinase catalytic subunit
MALKLGLGYFPLASVGIDAVERWIDIVDRDQDDQDAWLSRVLPCLNEYLMVHIANSGESEAPDTPSSKSRQKSLIRQDQSYKAIVRKATMLVIH